MKKLIIASAALFLLAVGMSSCKTHEKCPAYSAVDSIEQSDVKA